MYDRGSQIPISIDGIPCPFHYEAFFSSLKDHENKYWSYVPHIKDVKPGDIFGYLPRNFIPQEISQIPKERTGTHLGVVEQVLNIQEGKIELVIIDCTRFPHCKEDTRVKGGIGRSPLTIYFENGKAILRWGSRKKKWEKDIFLGRLKCL